MNNGALWTVLTAFLLAGCSDRNALETRPTLATPEITIMTFNVENLFDARDDPGKNDSTYLPLTKKKDRSHITACEAIEVERWRRDCLELDWNQEAVEFKLNQVAKTILATNNGRGPDLIALQEVENKAILQRLVSDYLQSAEYSEVVLIEGRDRRGIDVAFLSRLPLVQEPKLHPFDVPTFPDRAEDTRGILEATFRLPDGSLLTAFSVHFPAPYHPIELRELAYDHLNSLKRNVPPDHFVVAAGDFNTPQREMTQTTILDDRARPFWTIAHEVGCANCRGTNYWARGQSWSFLDMILFSPAQRDGSRWRLSPDQTYVSTLYAGQLNADNTPKRFNLTLKEGVSDHLPMLITLVASE